MKVRLLSMLVVAVFAAQASAASPSAGVKVQFSVLRTSYTLGEPVAVAMVISNTTNEPRRVAVGISSDIDTEFSCEGVSCNGPGRWAHHHVRKTGRLLAPKESWRRVFALNQHLVFTKPGTYSVKYETFLGACPVDSKGRDNWSARREFEDSGTLSVVIQAGDPDLAWVKSLLAELKTQDKAESRKAAPQGQHLSREEAAELLCWADTPTVIEPLVAAAKDPAMPNLARDVIPALQKFFKKNDGAKKGILEIAAATGTVSDAIAVFDKEGETIHSEWFKPIFASKSIMNIWPSLEYIRAHGTRDDIEAVEPLVNNDFSPPIAQLAAAVVKDLKARPPAKSPAAPGQEKK